MSIDALQLRHEIIRPVLKHLEPEIPYSMAAENLLMGTCAVESRMGQFIVQLDDGPAKGIFQMEPDTHDDIWSNYLSYRKPMYELVQKYCIVNISTPADLTGNLYYAAAMCRVHYFRVPDSLPDADDVYELAKYWKRWYNTNLGKGKVSEFVERYELLVA